MREIVLDIDRALTDHEYTSTVIGFDVNTIQVRKLWPGQFTKIDLPATIVFLEDRKMGQYLEINEKPYIDYKRGTGYVLEATDVVRGVIAGYDASYILQIK
jgi:hypothetical protein